MKSSSPFRRVVGLLVGLSLFVPATAKAESSVSGPSDAQQQQLMSSSTDGNNQGNQGEGGDPGSGPGDMSSNCFGNGTAFITGKVYDSSLNPVAGARVNMTLLGLTFPNPVTAGPWRAWETKADGSYSICTWEGDPIRSFLQNNGDSRSLHALVGAASPPQSAEGSDLGSQINLMVYAGTPTLTQDIGSVPRRSAACLDPARNATTMCELDFVLGAPTVTATAKTSDGSAVPNAMASLEYFYRPTSASLTEAQKNAQGVWVQLGLMPTNATGNFGMRGFTNPNQFRLKVQAPECYPEEGQECPFDSLGSQSDTFNVTVTTPGVPSSATAVWPSTGLANRDFVLVPANLRGSVVDGLGNPMYDIVQVTLTKENVTRYESTEYNGSLKASLEDGTWAMKVSAPSWASGTDADFSVTVADGVVTNISRTSAPAGAVCEISPCLTNIKFGLTPPNFLVVVKDSDGNVVEGADVQLSEYTSPAMQGGWPWAWKTGQQSGQTANGQVAGLVGFTLDAGKMYRVELNPSWKGSSDLVRTEYYLKVSEDGSQVRRCAHYNNDPRFLPCETGWTGNLSDPANLLVKSEFGGLAYSAVMKVANFRAVVCEPGAAGACTTVPQSNVNVKTWQLNQCGGPGCTSTGFYNWTNINAWSGQTGTISLSFENEGRYQIEVQPPQSANSGTQYAKNDIEFYADRDGEQWKFYGLDANGGPDLAAELTTTVVASVQRIILRLKSPSFIGVVQGSDGTKSSFSWVELRKETPSGQCSNCSQWLGGSSTNNDGVFALSLTEGKHVLVANPNFALESQGLTRTEFKINALDCDSDGGVEIYTYESTDCDGATLVPTVDGKIIINLQGANFAGTVKRPDGGQAAIAGVMVDIQKWTDCSAMMCGPQGDGYWTWVGKNDVTDQLGKFGFNLSEPGRYLATFRPPWDLQSQYSSVQVELNVSAGSPAVVVAVQDDSVFSVSPTGEFTVRLKLPNVSGTVTLPSGGFAANTWINVEKWRTDICGGGCYQWTPEVQGANTNASGDYGLNLPAGRWKITYNPPWNQTGVARGVRELVVTAGGTVCTLSTSDGDGTTCPGATVAPGDFDVQLPAPNFSGTVKNPDNTASQWSSIQFQRWDSGYSWWQWTNTWANTDNEGKFGINLTENGSYRVTFEPSWQSTGVSARTIFVRVCDSGVVVEQLADETAAKTGTTCSGTGTLSDPTTVYSLLGANLRGIVRDADGEAMGDAWVTILNCDDGEPGDWCQWDRGTNTRGFGTDKGRFSFNLANGGGRAVTKLRIEVNPPWNSTTGLVRGQFDVWVKDFDPTSTGDEWCLNADYNPGDLSCDEGMARSSTSTEWTVTLTAGNLAGRMFDPSGSSAVANGSMQVEKWTEQPWNPGSYYWQWTSYWANANQAGRFGLNIPGSDAGLFRISANPGWDNPQGYARRRLFVRVGSAGEWCQQEVNAQLINTASPYAEQCTFGTANEPGLLASGLAVRLSSSNLSGRLYVSSTELGSSDLAETSKMVRDANMWLQVKRTYDWDNNGVTDWTWWEHVSNTNSSGSSSASSRGKFGFNIDTDGDYRVNVDVSQRDSSALDGQFYVEFSAANCSTSCVISLAAGQASVAVPVDGGFAVKYPAANFLGTVKDKTGATAIRGSWIGITRSDTGEWVTGLSTGWNGANAGKFGTRLADGSYRVEVWPRWDDTSNGMRRLVTVVVSGGVVTSCSAGCTSSNPADPTDSSRDITLRGENLTGKVYYPGASDGTDAYATTTDGNQTPMPWAWVEVRTCGNVAGTQCEWGQDGVNRVDGIGSNQNGRVGLGLDPADNPYLVTVWPNWGLYSASPLRLLVFVDAEGTATWKYESETNGYDGLGSAFNPDFGRIPPNVQVTVQGVDAERFVKLYRCDTGNDPATPEADCLDNAFSEVVVVNSSEVSDNTWKASFTVTQAGVYKVVALRTQEDVAAGGTLAGASLTFAHDGTTTVDSTVSVRPLS